MKKNYIAVTIQENARFYSYIITATQSDNIAEKLKIKGLISANIFPTKRHASEVVTLWNAQYKENGAYLFDGGDCPCF